VNDNRLTAFPHEIRWCTALVELDVRGNLLQALPVELGLLNLQSVAWKNNPLTQPPLRLLDSGLKSVLDWLREHHTMDLSGRRLAILSDDTFSSGLVRELLLDNNFLNLPLELFNMLSLRHLSVRDNALQQLRSEIGQLGGLRSLHLDGNQLGWLPPTMSSLTKLATLTVSRNQITSFPVELSQLNLQSFELFGNPLLPPFVPSDYPAMDSLQPGVPHVVAVRERDAARARAGVFALEYLRKVAERRW